jgi:hypothetical protein
MLLLWKWSWRRAVRAHAVDLKAQQKEVLEMHRHAFRTLIVAAALTALVVPVFSATHSASACSNPGCTTTTTISGVIDTYVSPISLSQASATISERATTAQTPVVSLSGTVYFTVLDARGNNEGWIAYLLANGFSSSLFPLLPIPGSDVTVTATPGNLLTCYGPYSCGRGVGILPSSNLGLNPAVAAECPIEAIGEGSYAISVPINVTVTGLTAEKLGSYPASWFGSFTASVIEGQDPSVFPPLGCD